MTDVRTFENQYPQGDVFLRRIDALPEGLVQVKAEDGRYVVAHSETGHHHAIAASNDVQVWSDPKDELKLYLAVDNPTVLRHERSFDTHAPVEIGPGLYALHRQREHTPEGWRRAAD